MTPNKLWSLTLERVEGSGAAVFFNQPALNPIHNHNKCSWIGINFKILNGDGRYNRKPLLTPFFAMLSVVVYNCSLLTRQIQLLPLKMSPPQPPYHDRAVMRVGVMDKPPRLPQLLAKAI